MIAPPGVAGRPAFRVGRFSTVRRPTRVAITLAVTAVLFLVFCLNIGRGDYPLSIPDVVNVLFGGGSRIERFVVTELRLPRALTGVLVGAALAIAGAVTQSITRNALASPDILGITSGASVAAVALIVLGGSGTAVGLLATLGTSTAALVGGFLTAALIYLFAWRGGVEGMRLVLIGIAINAMNIALIGWLLVSATITDVTRAQLWLTGTLAGATWTQVWPVFAAVLVLGTATLALSFRLNAMRLGGDTARALGVNVQRSQAALLVVAVALAAVATSVAGPIGFVALAAPQIALRLTRSPEPPIVASAVVGAVVVVGSDLVARTVLPIELPVGIVTSALGGPFLLYLMIKANRKASV
ncbi:FecCD family ABC transporter permease [Rhodococcoides corynebacterioides]|uniref:Iron chelate uptake ABC transporter family permease subunit n=1 Tax=Rhodococcoides corynebacterioides TaxID=53972 RepID=A0ABS7P1V9_9NOCA|nr:iron chelate uptake ABC transporter family permease subunit [Rhodococcus corynebacterioides]MBY6366041.1 iron chelate uptake ABC transporter family permease subunit [Rhodococcus corynebacterioides]MBY6408872.1 iron chelate uptake ABC transporter family permease subunit [Rhodococcus corynebacterioides]